MSRTGKASSFNPHASHEAMRKQTVCILALSEQMEPNQPMGVGEGGSYLTETCDLSDEKRREKMELAELVCACRLCK